VPVVSSMEVNCQDRVELQVAETFHGVCGGPRSVAIVPESALQSTCLPDGRDLRCPIDVAGCHCRCHSSPIGTADSVEVTGAEQLVEQLASTAGRGQVRQRPPEECMLRGYKSSLEGVVRAP